MGGLGSTRWGLHQRKRTAEECLILDLRIVLRETPQARHGPIQGIITWPNLDRPEHPARCGYTLDLTDRQTSWLELQYQADGKPVVCRITLICVSAFGGRHDGHQWFGVCPGDRCGRYVRKVFCRPDIPYFHCVVCHDLTYLSRQTAHWDDRGDMAAAARMLGMPLPVWKAYVRRYAGDLCLPDVH